MGKYKLVTYNKDILGIIPKNLEVKGDRKKRLYPSKDPHLGNMNNAAYLLRSFFAFLMYLIFFKNNKHSPYVYSGL